MPYTLGDTWRAVKLQVPGADPLLCRQWVQSAYGDLADRYPWHFLFQHTLLSVLASRSVTAVVTQGSAAVTSAALFVATDLNRQFRIGSGPTYTIITFTDASNIVLDQNYGDVDAAAASATILDAYVRCPADFGSWETVIDLSQQRPILTSYSQLDLAAVDPARTQSQDALWLVDLDIDTTDRVRYEWWPRQTTARQYPALYKMRPQRLADTFTFRGVLGDRYDVLIAGALLHCARWPGTIQQRNPYFVLGLVKELRDEWEKQIHRLGLRDDDQAIKSWSTFPWHEWRNLGQRSTEQLRASDATLADYV